MLARRCSIQATYQGVDISDDIAGEIISATYTDSLDEADKADIIVKDDAKKWLLKWKPRRTDILTMQIVTRDWNHDGDSGFLDCGVFTVDQVRYAGRPTTATIGGVSMPADQNFSGTPKNRTWEQATLSEIASSLLPGGYSLDFRSDDDPAIEYVEQKDTDDCAFLFDMAKKYGYRIKLLKNKVMLASAQWLESQVPSFEITEEKLFSWSLDAELRCYPDTHRAAPVCRRSAGGALFLYRSAHGNRHRVLRLEGPRGEPDQVKKTTRINHRKRGFES